MISFKKTRQLYKLLKQSAPSKIVTTIFSKIRRGPNSLANKNGNSLVNFCSVVSLLKLKPYSKVSKLRVILLCKWNHRKRSEIHQLNRVIMIISVKKQKNKKIKNRNRNFRASIAPILKITILKYFTRLQIIKLLSNNLKWKSNR